MRFLFDLIGYYLNKLFNFDQDMLKEGPAAEDADPDHQYTWDMFNVDKHYFCLAGLPKMDFTHEF